MADSDALALLVQDLGQIFAGRLQSVVTYGDADRLSKKSPVTTLTLVDRLTAADLRACAGRAKAWHQAGLATPLFLGAGEFSRSLDAFPFEFGAILSDHTVVMGPDPFHGLQVEASDLRRACELQVRSHLLHLRQGYIETRGRNDLTAELVKRSAAPLAALLKNISRLNANSPVDGVLARVAQLRHGGTLTAGEAETIFPEYLDAVEQLAGKIDRWSAA